MINIFLNENFTFNDIYSRDIGVSIITFDNPIFNNIGVEYKEEIEIEHNLVEYSPSYTQKSVSADAIELNLLVYNPATMKPLKLEEYDMEELYDWLITDNFAPFISDDGLNLIYYFKVINIKKMLTFGSEGYLQVTFLPFSKYAYQREEYEVSVDGKTSFEIYNSSRENYYPMIEIINNGDKTTVNKINELEIIGLSNSEKVIIDNLMKIVQSEDGKNKFNCCNRNWIKLNKRESNIIVLEGNMRVKIICELPLIR